MLVERASLCAKGVVVLLGEGPRLYWCHADGDSPVLCRDSIQHPSVSPSIYRPTTSPRLNHHYDPHLVYCSLPRHQIGRRPPPPPPLPQVKNLLNAFAANATEVWMVHDLFDLGDLVRNLFKETPIGYTTIKRRAADIIYVPSAHRKHF
uniref:Uncharacterized protein n=1 Tax=Kwoniella bestiolae CBS 10118 TaxID=1296100 RepID=A0A1B9G1D8_9TREE|nr:hypothetical protein I302_06305 [Kwoniella bestiolae CBS 10118]OCF24844.1 hypothetical protein I302_06305 [Kwoniella bestiolae CBS 10118]